MLLFKKNSLKIVQAFSIFCFAIFYSISFSVVYGQEINLNRIKLPPGFEISIYASRIQGARSMALGDKGTLFVGSRSHGKGYAVVDHNNDNKADEVITVAQRLNSPNGVAFKGGTLYVAEIDRILRYEDIEIRLKNPPKPVVVNDSFPKEKHHGWKFIRFGLDGMLYVPVGAPCNVCKSVDNRFATIMRMRPDGTNLEIFSYVVRNTVGFDWHPVMKELWFTDNGRDWMGDDRPPDELNHAPNDRNEFRFSLLSWKDHKGSEVWCGKSCSDFIQPAIELGSHVAALGMRFYNGQMFPAIYRNRIFIAEHGSWNRTVPTGYRITAATLGGNKPIEYEVFLCRGVACRCPCLWTSCRCTCYA